MNIKILFLDFNGTLINDWASSFAGMRAIFKKFNKPCPSLEEYIRSVAFLGDYIKFYYNHGIGEFVGKEELYNIYIPAYYAHIKNPKIIPGVHDTLTKFKQEGIEIHIITAAAEDFAGDLIEAVNVAQYCSSFHFDINNKAECINAIISDMSIQPDQCVMIGDLPSDVLHAKEARIRGIAFLNTYVPRDLFSGLYGMDYATPHFDGLLDYFLSE